MAEEAMDELFEIKLMVGGTYYPLTIPRKDERLYREAARRINDKLNRYREHFPQLSEEKYYVMAAVHIAMVNVKPLPLAKTSKVMSSTLIMMNSHTL